METQQQEDDILKKKGSDPASKPKAKATTAIGDVLDFLKTPLITTVEDALFKSRKEETEAINSCLYIFRTKHPRWFWFIVILDLTIKIGVIIVVIMFLIAATKKFLP